MACDLALIVNKQIGKWLDDTQQSLEDIISWIHQITTQTVEESRIKNARCEICISKEDPRDLELHHPGHERYNFRTITVCKKCHQYLTTLQMKNEALLNGKTTECAKTALFLMGLQEILVLKADKTGNSNYKTLAMLYPTIIREHLKK